VGSSGDLDELTRGIEAALGERWPLSREEAARTAARAVLWRVRALGADRDLRAEQATRLAGILEQALFEDVEQAELLRAWLSYQSVLGDASLDRD
jgi:hypothetical protein